MTQSDTGAIAQEYLVDGQATDAICFKISDALYSIDGKEIPLPVEVRSAAMLMNIFLVDAGKVEKILRGTQYRPLTIWPGKALVQLLAIDYQENDLGDYNEGAIIFPVLTPYEKCFPILGAWLKMTKGAACNYVYRMPVNQGFTTHAGRFIWGFPKWPTKMEVTFGNNKAMGCFTDQNQLVYKIHANTGGNINFKDQKSPSVTVRNGKAWKTYGTSSATGVTLQLGGNLPEIGNEHPLALELRSLGLPKKPVFSVSATHVQMSFDGPECVNVGEKFSS